MGELGERSLEGSQKGVNKMLGKEAGCRVTCQREDAFGFKGQHK